MGLFSGFFKKGTSTTTSDVPDWLKDQYHADFNQGQDIYSRAQGQADFYSTNPRQILGVSGEEDVAAQHINNVMREARGDVLGNIGGIGEASDGMGGAIEGLEGIDLDALISQYENEYTDDVVDTSLAGMDRKREQERARNEAASAAVGGVSNSRRAVAEALGDQLHGMDRAQLEAQLRSGAFDTAAGLGMDAAGFEQGIQNDVAGIYGDQAGLEMDQAALAAQRADLGEREADAVGEIGALRRGLGQAQMDENYNAGKEATSWLADIYGSTRSTKPSAQKTSTPTSSPAKQALGVATSLAGAWLSDEDAKYIDGGGLLETDTGALDTIRAMGDLERYGYKEGLGHRTDKHAGLIAQRLEKANPDLVISGEDGLRRVDPFMLMSTVVGAVRELDRKASK